MMTGFTAFLPESYLTWGDNIEFLIRILLAGCLGIAIGFERSRRQKDAGIRTHCIIAITSAAFMILSKYCFSDLEIGTMGTRGADPARIAAQVVSGISFLGAGVIFKDKNASIKGLTTAAGIWATAAVGMSIGAGLYWMGLIETIVVVFSQTLLHKFPIGNDALAVQELQIKIKDNAEMHEAIRLFIEQHSGKIEQSEIKRSDGMMSLKLTVRCSEPITHEDGMALIKQYSDLLEISL